MKRATALLAVLLLALLIAGGWYLYASPVQARVLYGVWGVPGTWVEQVAGWMEQVAGWLGAVDPDAGPSPIIVLGTIEADEVAIVSELSGRVVGLFAAEGDEVQAGTLLLQLDETDVLATLAEAEAVVEVARANLAATEAGPRDWEVEAAEASVAQAETRL
ncbi:MAG TPA: biotin/lipoyl-binding protein [Anaerolineae bacterium]|nr:biotin/lipoyl-binding protein [Anaerolineae bacterium]